MIIISFLEHLLHLHPDPLPRISEPEGRLRGRQEPHHDELSRRGGRHRRGGHPARVRHPGLGGACQRGAHDIA